MSPTRSTASAKTAGPIRSAADGNSGQLTARQRAALTKHRVAYLSTTGRAAAPPTRLADTDLRTACQDHRAEAATAPRGWLRDRFQQCFAKRLNYIVVRNDNGTPAGEITFELWLLGWGNHGVRQADLSRIGGGHHRLHRPRQRHRLAEPGDPAADQRVHADHRGYLRRRYRQDVDQWFQAPAYAFTNTSAPSTGVGADFVWNTTLTFDLRIGTLPIRPTTQSNIGQSRVRFDSGARWCAPTAPSSPTTCRNWY